MCRIISGEGEKTEKDSTDEELPIEESETVNPPLFETVETHNEDELVRRADLRERLSKSSLPCWYLLAFSEQNLCRNLEVNKNKDEEQEVEVELRRPSVAKLEVSTEADDEVSLGSGMMSDLGELIQKAGATHKKICYPD